MHHRIIVRRHYRENHPVRTHLRRFHARQRVPTENLVANERFGSDNLKYMKKVGEGRDRTVLDLGKGKVLKVAKTAEGIEQNAFERGLSDFTLPEEHRLDLLEEGKDYVVMEKANKPDKRVNDLLRPLKRFDREDFAKKTPELQDEMHKAGLGDYMNYDLGWNDFTAKRNWGIKNDKPVLVDGGVLNEGSAQKVAKDSPLWTEIKQQRRNSR